MDVNSATSKVIQDASDKRSTSQEKHALYILEDELRQNENHIRDLLSGIQGRCAAIERALNSDEQSGAFLQIQRMAYDVDITIAVRHNTWKMLAALLTEPEMKMLLAARRGARVAVK